MKTFDTLDEMWCDMIEEVAERGVATGSRDGACVETLGYSSRLTGLEHTFLLNPVRLADPHYASAEMLWYLSGDSRIEMLLPYAPTYGKFTRDGAVADGTAYGHRMGLGGDHDLLSLATEVLRQKPESRQAVVSLWRRREDLLVALGDAKDLPCAICLSFYLRQGRLHCVAYVRSQDVWLGAPYDVYSFTCLQRVMADELQVGYGSYTHCVGSLHVYDRYARRATTALDAREEGVKLSFATDHTWPRQHSHRRSLTRALYLEHRAAELKAWPTEMTATEFGERALIGDSLLLCVEKLSGIRRVGREPFSTQLRAARDQFAAAKKQGKE